MTRQLTEHSKLNEDIALFPQVHPVTADMKRTFEGVSRLVMLDRYAFKDTELKTLGAGDTVVLTAKEDPQFPARAIGVIDSIQDGYARITLEPEFAALVDDSRGRIVKPLSTLDKPLELFYEQIAKRVAQGLSAIENPDIREKIAVQFEEVLATLDFVPAGRVLYGAGSGSEVTYFNCYVMPYPQDSREGINEHRGEVMGIMSRGGGVGTNGSTLRPRNNLARGVNGKSSGSVSWLNDIANLTNLVQQGGSRRGAQMIMLADWHPDIFEFVISKMQNPRILRFIIETTEDEQIRKLAQDKLKFTPFTQEERSLYEVTVEQYEQTPWDAPELEKAAKYASEKLADGGTYSVHDPEFLSGANISVAFTKEFMEAVENDGTYELRFPDVDNYDAKQMEIYNRNWHESGDVREWPLPVKTHRTIKAKELWNLVNICATYAAEPGVFFIDNANEDTNAAAYGQKVVATNPCGEQPLAPYSVCNLAAVNLANMVTPEGKLNVERLERVVKIGVRMQDNVIDSTPYFLEKNEIQAKGERRVGLGVMGLADLLIKMQVGYGTAEGNEVVDEVFRIIAETAYRASIDLAQEKGSFPFLGEEDYEKRLAFSNTGYMKRMPRDIRTGVIDFGIRNSHILTVAPTGSTGTMIGVSTGLEPYYSFKYFRSGRLGKYIEVNAAIVTEVLGEDFDGDLPDYFVSSMDLTPEQHVDAQTTIQRWVDSSLSKTVNAPKGYSVEQVESVYERLYAGGAKGGTVYVDGSRDAQVLSLSKDDSDVSETPQERPKQVLVETIPPLEGTSAGKNVGTEIGDTCPICTIGTVEDLGGCATCTNCQAQLKCGL